MAAEFTITQGNRAPALGYQMTDAAGANPNLTGATVTFSMRNASDGTVKITDGTCTITDALTGKVSYAWGTTDTNTVADFEAKFTVHWGDGTTTDFPTSKTVTENYITVHVVDDARAVN